MHSVWFLKSFIGNLNPGGGGGSCIAPTYHPTDPKPDESSQILCTPAAVHTVRAFKFFLVRPRLFEIYENIEKVYVIDI